MVSDSSTLKSDSIPRCSSGLHGVGESDVIGPHIKLPLVQANEPTKDRARVNPDTHVQIVACLLTNEPRREGEGEEKKSASELLWCGLPHSL